MNIYGSQAGPEHAEYLKEKIGIKNIGDIKTFIRDYLKDLNGGVDVLISEYDNDDTEIIIENSKMDYSENINEDSDEDEESNEESDEESDEEDEEYEDEESDKKDIKNMTKKQN